MWRLRPFQAAAQENGFVHARGSEDSTVQWLTRQTPDTTSKTHQRICVDSLTASATVYWTDSQGNVASKSFRRPLALKEWLAMDSLR